ncbi:hypothetical protein N7454_007092 [Penicillium verhagenii]|nr:hypothetical protein N7454_007092 [Penicillium verhagenii]
MADKDTGPIHEHESFFDRLLHRHKKEDKHEQEHEHEANDPSSDLQQEAETDKYKDQIKNDEHKYKDHMRREANLQSQSETYDHLM